MSHYLAGSQHLVRHDSKARVIGSMQGDTGAIAGIHVEEGQAGTAAGPAGLCCSRVPDRQADSEGMGPPHNGGLDHQCQPDRSDHELVVSLRQAAFFRHVFHGVGPRTASRDGGKQQPGGDPRALHAMLQIWDERLMYDALTGRFLSCAPHRAGSVPPSAQCAPRVALPVARHGIVQTVALPPLPGQPMRLHSTCLTVAAIAAFATAAPAAAQTASDSAAITAAARDYIEGWYAGDAARMERSLHPDLAKRIVGRDPAGARSSVNHMTAATLIAQTARGGGRDTPAERRRGDVRILDIFGSAASVRVDADSWVDFMHLGKVNGEWKIINVMWETGTPPGRSRP